MAGQHLVIVEREPPLVSLCGRAMDPKLTSDHWQALKNRNNWMDYDYTKVFLSGAGNPTETVGLPSQSIQIVKKE